ncbi:MAG: PAS domain S-box protein, partial [Bacteroidota bacterium]|nr:PAS domain S-box protein [Bacteroidota bacterium]
MKNNLPLEEWPTTPDQDKAFYMAVIDRNDRLTFVNTPLFKAFHQAKAPIANKAFLDMIHRLDLDRVRESFADCRRHGETVIVEARVRNGHYKWVKWKISPLMEERSRENKLLCLGYDIAGEEQQQKYSTLAGRNYQSIMEGLNIGWLVRDKDGALIAANQRAAEILDTTLDVLYNDTSILPSSPFSPQSNRIIAWPCGDGQERFILWNSQPLFENDGSEPYAVVSTLHDMTKEKLLEKEVQAREALFSSFMDHTPYVSWIIDENNNLVYANRSLLKYFHGWKEVIGKDMSMFIPQPLFLALREKHDLALREQRAEHGIIKSVMADGLEHVFRVSVFPIHGASRPLAGGEALDITESYTARQEILKLESQLAKQKLKQQKNTAEAIIHAQQEERARLGHEMHDNVNQILASAQLFIGQLDSDNPEFASIKARSIEIVGLAIEELRQLARDMVMPDFKEDGL